jgi:hypothetical protein
LPTIPVAAKGVARAAALGYWAPVINASPDFGELPGGNRRQSRMTLRFIVPSQALAGHRGVS